ncbi:MAG: O-antigen ligase, partial [Flavobacteriales bacterium]
MKSSTYLAFYTLITIIVFNLNGMLYMLVGVLQLMTPLLIICIGVLTLNLYPLFIKGIGAVGKIYVGVVFGYLIVGFGSLVINGAELKTIYIVTNIISVITVMCIAAFTYSYLIERERSYIKPLFFMVLLSTSSIPFSPILLQIYKVPPAEIARGFGFFANPNEGGILSVIGLGLLLATQLPGYQKILFYTILLINSVLTFSKSAMLLFGLVSIAAFLTSTSKVKFRYSFVILGAFMVAAYVAPIFYDNLDRVQKRRIDQVLAIATQGEINADTTSSRSELWKIGLDKINDNVLFGNGLGQLHHMKGGISSLGVDQGVHNVFLMLWGEAGLFVLIGFIFFCCAYLFNWFVLIKTMPKEILTITMVSFMCLMMDMMSAHNVLNLRMHNLFLGVSLGCFAYFNMLAKQII